MRNISKASLAFTAKKKDIRYAAGISRTDKSIYVSRVFKETTGESPISYLIRVRLVKACGLLAGNGASVREIARQVGYEDAYYFSKLFKKYYGVSPMEYRRMKEKPVLKSEDLEK